MVNSGLNCMRNSKGQSLVEAAVLLPILLLIVFGIIEFGRIFSAYAIVNNVARDCARRAAIYNYDEVETKADIVSELRDTFNITADMVDATLFLDSEADKAIKVRIVYKVPLYAPIVSSIIDSKDGESDGNLAITAISSMRLE